MNKAFAELIWKTTKLYFNNMITNSVKQIDQVRNLEKTFKILRHYGVSSVLRSALLELDLETFLWYMIDQRAIRANPNKIKAVLSMKSPTAIKEVQKLTDCIALLGRLKSRSVDKWLLFFKVLKKKACFGCDEEVEQAFQSLKEYLGRDPQMVSLIVAEPLSVYLAVSYHK